MSLPTWVLNPEYEARNPAMTELHARMILLGLWIYDHPGHEDVACFMQLSEALEIASEVAAHAAEFEARLEEESQREHDASD